MPDDAAAYRQIAIDVFSEGKVDLIDDLFAEDYVEHAAPPGVPPNRESLRQFVADLRSAFPDFRYDILQQYQDGDTHIGLVRASGTMSGDFMGMPASNKAATWDEVHIGRMADGKVLEHWAVIDAMAMMTQLGFVPEMGP